MNAYEDSRNRARARTRAIAAATEPAAAAMRRRWMTGDAIYVPEVDPR